MAPSHENPVLFILRTLALGCVVSHETTPGLMPLQCRSSSFSRWEPIPVLWRLEVVNVLEMGIRRGRHDAAFQDATLADLALLPISVDLETDRQAWSATLRLAERHKLTMYDAAYLELAQRRGLPLATLDAELRDAASAEGVILIGHLKSRLSPQT
jgi:predicted nucleic acid-binding protein